MMSPRSVLLLEDDSDLRTVLCDLFDCYGARCTGVGSLNEMQNLLAHGRLPFDLAILDVNLGAGQPSGVDAYRWLRERSFSGEIVFLTGHGRSAPRVAEAYALGVKVLEKPVAIDDLVKLLREKRKGT
jgi:DNA-binding response OmpR family regulator